MKIWKDLVSWHNMRYDSTMRWSTKTNQIIATVLSKCEAYHISRSFGEIMINHWILWVPHLRMNIHVYIYTHWKYIDTISIHIQSIRLHLYMEYGEFSISMWACQRVSVTYSHDFEQTFGSRSGWWINSNIHELITNIFPWDPPPFPWTIHDHSSVAKGLTPHQHQNLRQRHAVHCSSAFMARLKGSSSVWLKATEGLTKWSPTVLPTWSVSMLNLTGLNQSKFWPKYQKLSEV